MLNAKNQDSNRINSDSSTCFSVTPIIDIHCDLLSYLAEAPGRSVEDRVCRCSYPDLIKGGVKLQTVALFSKTGPESVEFGKQQVACFLKLINSDSKRFGKMQPSLASPFIQLIPAIENASVFASETEHFDTVIERLESYIQAMGSIFYISLTWDEENRFGGGNRSNAGLKEDGKRLIEYLSGKKIAIDLSHTSDQLAFELLNFIDKKGLTIPLIASHSNFRKLSNYPRNLPDTLASELIRRKGLIGLNFFGPFVHDTDPTVLARHVEYGLSLGGENSLCFGADFFFCGSESLSSLKQKYQRDTLFYKTLENASVYPDVLRLFQDKISLKETQLQKIAHQNALTFLKKNL